MNRKAIRSLALSTILGTALFAQLPPPGAPAQGGAAPGAPAQETADGNKIPAEKQPNPKSEKEYQAVVAMINAAQGGDRGQMINAADNLIKEFKDTEFKQLALEILTTAYQEQRDVPKMTVYAEMALKENPKNYRVLLTMAKGIADGTKEFDLDRDEKLARVEKLVSQALDHLKDAPRPQEQITDDQWLMAKKDFEAQAWEIRGMSAAVQKKYDEAITSYKKAIELSNNPDPVINLRLGDAYWQAKKYDECVSFLDQTIAQYGSNPGVTDFANNRKKLCVEAKAKGQ